MRGFDGAAGGEAGGTHEIGASRKRGEVVLRETGGRFQEVNRDGIGVKEFRDGFGRKVVFRDCPRDEAGDDLFAEGDEDDVAGHKRNVGGVGEGATAGAVDFGGYYLIKHTGIIA